MGFRIWVFRNLGLGIWECWNFGVLEILSVGISDFAVWGFKNLGLGCLECWSFGVL